jgi:C4-dicarboxylate-specific signal transduction histidine kinase
MFARKLLEQDTLEALASVADTIAQGIERKRTEEKLQESEQALRAREAELAHATRVMTMGEVTSSIAHEINQPLGAIVNYGNACLRLLKDGSTDLATVTPALSAIVQDANRASSVIARIRALAKKSTPEIVAVSLKDVVADVLAVVRQELTQRRIVLSTDLSEDLSPVLGDRIQLQQVLLNLVMNGIEAMSSVPEDERRLSICARSHLEEGEQFVLMAVQDSGIGLRPEQVPRLFETFYTTKVNGMGMGLAISRSIVQALGGRLRVVSNGGPGATFQFILPAQNRGALC